MFSMKIWMSLNVTSSFILSVKAISPNSTATTVSIFNSRRMLNLYFILFLQHFLDRFHKSINFACPYRGEDLDVSARKFFHQVILVTADLYRACDVFHQHVGTHPRDRQFTRRINIHEEYFICKAE